MACKDAGRIDKMNVKTASYAVTEATSKGRAFAQKPHPYRSDFARDRDRIIHCEAFRRLEGKTQVFMAGVNDNYRNRLTHSIEVAQIGRTVATALGLNENLTEAICLAHDMGHSPFGHSGEAVLNRLMDGAGGFEHNMQTVRIVELLEHPYPDFPGLNLMYETRLGLAKHRTVYDKSQGTAFPELNCPLEGQIADAADRIAYNCHDFEDAMRARLIEPMQLESLSLYTDGQKQIEADRLEDPFIRRTRTAKAMMDILVSDLIDASSEAIRNAGVKTVADVCSHQESLIVLSAGCEADLGAFGKFMYDSVYMHDDLLAAAKKTEERLSLLFEILCGEPQKMPAYYLKLVESEGLKRTVCDYIAGMTDRYCLAMIERM
jgi:dGTPase